MKRIFSRKNQGPKGFIIINLNQRQNKNPTQSVVGWPILASDGRRKRIINLDPLIRCLSVSLDEDSGSQSVRTSADPQ